MGIFGKPPDSKPDILHPQSLPSPPAGPATTPQPPAAGLRATSVCVIGSKTKIKGELAGDEDVIVEGEIEGEVRLTKDLRVAQGGLVKAIIQAQSVIISGEVVGDCSANARVEVQATGRLTGDIRAPRIVIAEGAMFRGNSDMSGDRKDKLAQP
jgi:cytoskeletal protein CcmA (bactofilin family)